jgi:16S rRNA (cytosine967-C5)-methyltransferase
VKSLIPRNLALEALNRLDHSPGGAERYLERTFLQEPHLSDRDRAFIVHLVQGVLRWRLRLDWIIQQTVRFPFKKIEPPVLNILRIAIYQILFMDRIPESAAVNEAVAQAKKAGQEHVVGFVNGLLRYVCRHKDRIAFPDRENERVPYLSISHSYPEWLVQKWIRELGIDFTERLLQAGNQILDLVIRVNTLKTDREGLIKSLEDDEVIGRPTPYSPDGIRVERLHRAIGELRSFRQGLFQVQGEAAQVCSHFLYPRPGEFLLDLCAGLGGKTTHMSQLTQGKGLILALDMNHGKLLRLAQSSQRLGTGGIRSIVSDASSQLSSLFRCSFDRILVDGPCSGLGIISRHPDVKWARDEDEISRLALLQKDILSEAVPLLREGGTMLYVTCTISREENEEVVSDFLERNKGIVLEDLKDHVPEWGFDLIDGHGFLRTFPHIHHMEGFFGALFRKLER